MSAEFEPLEEGILLQLPTAAHPEFRAALQLKGYQMEFCQRAPLVWQQRPEEGGALLSNQHYSM